MASSSKSLAPKGSSRQLLTREDLREVAERRGVVALGDNSNLWIEGKKHAACIAKSESKEDPGWRIHVGNLFKTVLKKRKLALFRIFGSTPPPTDSVWEVFEEGGISVDTSERSSWTRKEKRVDSRFQSLLIWEAGFFDHWAQEKRAAHRTCYIIIGGDGDYSDCVKLALESGIKVEVWSWSWALNVAYKKMKNNYRDLLSLHFLDDVFKEIGFSQELNAEQKICRAHMNPERTVVFVAPSESENYGSFARKVYDFWDSLCVYAYLVPTYDRRAILLILHFPVATNDFRKLLDEAKEPDKAGEQLDVKTFPEFFSAATEVKVRPHELMIAQPKFMDNDSETEQSDREEAEKPDGDEEAEQPDGDEEDEGEGESDGGEWVVAGEKEGRKKNQQATAQRQKQERRRKKVNSEPCPHREFCTQRDCTWFHTPAEITFFNENQGVSPIRFWKTKPCSKNCPGKLWHDCTYLHNKEPTLCKNCLGTPCLGSATAPCSAERPLCYIGYPGAEKYRELQQKGYFKK